MLLELLPRHGLGDELVEPGSEQEAVEAARDAVDRGYDVVVAAGGDGTIGLIGRQLMGTPHRARDPAPGQRHEHPADAGPAARPR